MNNLPALIEQHQDKFLTVMADPEKFNRLRNLFESQISKNPKLATCSPASLMGTLKQLAAYDIDLSAPDVAYLIPYGNECTLQISYLGLIQISMKKGAVKKIYSEVVFDSDEFEIDLSAQEIKKHKPGVERKNIVGVYAVALLANNEQVIAYMAKNQIDEAKNRAKTQQFWKHYESMARKTIIKKVLKLIPKTNLSDVDKPAVEIGKRDFNLDSSVEILEAESASIFDDEPTTDVENAE